MRLAARDDAPRTKYRDLVADVHDETDHVLNQDEGNALFIANSAEQQIEFRQPIHAESNCRLVEQNHFRLAYKSGGNFNDALLPKRQLGASPVRKLSHPDEFQRLTRRVFRLVFLFSGSPRPKPGTKYVRFSATMKTRHHVLKDGHAAEQLRRLKCAAEATSRDFARLVAPDGHAAKQYLSLSRGMDAADDVEQRRFASAVRADQTSNFAWPDVKIDAVENTHAAELYCDVTNSKGEVRHDMLSFSSSRT